MQFESIETTAFRRLRCGVLASSAPTGQSVRALVRSLSLAASKRSASAEQASVVRPLISQVPRH